MRGSIFESVFHGPRIVRGWSRRKKMRQSTQTILETSRRYLDIIGGRALSEAEARTFINETVDAYEKHVNRGFIAYRKSVTEAGQFAALEWTGQGSMVRDLLGREYIDCLGGFGIFSAGINHPRIVKAVTDQMQRMALNSQELLEPWRAALAKLLAGITPGELSCSFFINNGTDAVEGAIKLARLYTGRNTFLSTLGGLRKVPGFAVLDGQGDISRTLPCGIAGCSICALRRRQCPAGGIRQGGGGRHPDRRIRGRARARRSRRNRAAAGLFAAGTGAVRPIRRAAHCG